MRNKRDYSDKRDLRNPHRKEDKNLFSKRLVFYIFGTIGVLFIILEMIHPQLGITTITTDAEVESDAQLIKDVILEQLDQRRFGIINQRSFIFFDYDETSRKIQDEVGVEQVQFIRKPLARQLHVKVYSEPYATVWISNTQQFYTDSQGFAKKQYQSSSRNITDQDTITVRLTTNSLGIPVIVDESATEVTLGQSVAERKVIDSILHIHEFLTRQTKLQPSVFVLTNPFIDFVTVETLSGVQVLLPIDDTLEQQLNKLLILLSQKISDLAMIDYIDLRFGENIFYK